MRSNRRDFRERPPGPSFRVIISVTITLSVVIIVVVIFGSRLLFSAHSDTNLVSTAGTTQIPTTTQPATAQCDKYLPTGKYKTLTIQNLSINQGCVLVIDSYSGSLGGVTWNSGGVIVLAGGSTYNGTITDGEYQTVTQYQAKSFFCQKVDQLKSLNQAHSTIHPLDNANWPPCQ